MTAKTVITWTKSPDSVFHHGIVGAMPLFMVSEMESSVYRLTTSLCGQIDIPFSGLRDAKAAAEERMARFLKMTGLVPAELEESH